MKRQYFLILFLLLIFSCNSCNIDTSLEEESQSELDLEIIEEFNNNINGWKEVDNDSLLSKIQGGRYILKSKSTGEDIISPVGNHLFDFKIETTISQTDGSNDGYGILWGCSILFDCKYFLITSNGYYLIPDNRGWKKSYVINPNTNKLSVVRAGYRVKHYINDVLIEEVIDSSAYSPNVAGLSVGAHQTIEVEDFYIAQEYIYSPSFDSSLYVLSFNTGIGRYLFKIVSFIFVFIWVSFIFTFLLAPFKLSLARYVPKWLSYILNRNALLRVRKSSRPKTNELELSEKFPFKSMWWSMLFISILSVIILIFSKAHDDVGLLFALANISGILFILGFLWIIASIILDIRMKSSRKIKYSLFISGLSMWVFSFYIWSIWPQIDYPFIEEAYGYIMGSMLGLFIGVPLGLYLFHKLLFFLLPWSQRIQQKIFSGSSIFPLIKKPATQSAVLSSVMNFGFRFFTIDTGIFVTGVTFITIGLSPHFSDTFKSIFSISYLVFALVGVPLSYYSRTLMKNRPILYLRSFSYKNAPRILERIVLPATRGVGFLTAVTHQLQKPVEILPKTKGALDNIDLEILNDEAWKGWIIQQLKKSPAAIIDLTILSKGVLWELDQAINILPSDKIVVLLGESSSYLTKDLEAEKINCINYKLDKKSYKKAKNELKDFLKDAVIPALANLYISVSEGGIYANDKKVKMPISMLDKADVSKI